MSEPNTDRDGLAWPGRRVGSLWVVAHGSGRPLVMLHGNSQNHHAFDRVIPFLAADHLLLGIDSRGHGRSPGTGVPLRIENMADDVGEVVRLLDLSGADLLGFSDGANIALELAIRHPGRFRSVMICGANLSPAGLTASARRQTDLAYGVVSRVSRWVPALRPVNERIRLMARQPHISLQDLATVRLPVLVMAGEHDVVRPEHTAEIALALPLAQISVVPGAGHMIPRRHPAELARRVTQFLAEVESQGPSTDREDER